MKLNFNQSQKVSSNNYPKHYPVTDDGYYESCIRRFYAERGASRLPFLTHGYHSVTILELEWD